MVKAHVATGRANVRAVHGGTERQLEWTGQPQIDWSHKKKTANHRGVDVPTERGVLSTLPNLTKGHLRHHKVDA
jgi:hypothetical protein